MHRPTVLHKLSPLIILYDFPSCSSLTHTTIGCGKQGFLELHNRTAKIEPEPHRTRSSLGSVPSLGNRTGFSFYRVELFWVQ
ncbi:uncharacterized protein P174DRAFT_130782 [Aspergillus novofumigatus IBT 16806]|uniref:Uncharacterized protein n=1 Tax=Aspergillus novofumigatus (strain IBT 16806) TaxID=1392255 RepID=A0A2I1CCI8_ASPN1|nr:uncharacterized protein P174DRAFT_130782 [Aspergillus novofumigatus IBT 16806]PKX95331.1 hypothetical protein P174DRAFT_130782 [Aspergillus novofumigatus IBT 16806]